LFKNKTDFNSKSVIPTPQKQINADADADAIIKP